MRSLVVLSFVIALYAGIPIIVVSGCVRWFRHSRKLSVFSSLSLAGFIAGTTSAMLALVSTLYSLAVGGFPYYDPLLMKIFGLGIFLSLLALGASLGGVWRRNLLRWHAPALSLGMLALWVGWMLGE